MSKHPVSFVIAVVLIVLTLAPSAFAVRDSLTTVTWDSISNRPCFKRMVYCILESTTTYSQFSSLVSTNSHTIYRYNDFGPGVIATALVVIGATEDIATEAQDYWDDPAIEYACPDLVEGEECWPDDEYYDDKQWYLNITPDNDPGENENPPPSDIDWHETVNGGGAQRGRSDVKIGIIDSGIALDGNGDLVHPDLWNEGLQNDRFFLGYNWVDDNEPIEDEHGHGTMVAGVLAARANNDGPNEEPNWGVVGVNTVSKIYIDKVMHPNGNVIPNADMWDALGRLAGDVGCDIVTMSLSIDLPQRGFERMFQRLINAEVMPLFVVSAANDGAGFVAFPAVYAYWGQLDGHERGYSQVISVGASLASFTRTDYSSYEEEQHHISILAPGGPGGPQDNPHNLWTTKLQEGNDYHGGFSGTSAAAPLVAGVASLVLSEDMDQNNGQKTLNAWSLRRIIEKTAIYITIDPTMDPEDPEEEVYDQEEITDKEGFGLVKCDLAVQNRDLYQWTLTEGTWYYISSRVNPIQDGEHNYGKRIVDELTMEMDEEPVYFQRIDELHGWDVEEQEILEFDPDNEIDDEIPWQSHQMFKIKIKELPDGRTTDSLLICGQSVPIDDPIDLDYNGNGGVNWVAYYPDFSSSAEYALDDIADDGDPTSVLILAKNSNGKFYAPRVSFNNIPSMEPGEGFIMTVSEDIELTYPTEPEESPPPPENKYRDRPIADTDHFQYIEGTGDFLPIIIDNLVLNNITPAAGDEIGVFSNDSLCVGAVSWQARLLGFAAWKDDESTETIDGYTSFEALSFRYWDDSEEQEIGQINFGQQRVDNLVPPYWTPDLEFNAPLSDRPEIPYEITLGPIYPNPFNSTTTIRYSLDGESSFRLRLFDVAGRQVVMLVSGQARSGSFEFSLDGSNLASGSYFVRLDSGTKSITKEVQTVK